MRKVLFVSLIAALAVLSSCHHDSTNGYLKLQLSPMFGSNKLILDSTYQSPDGRYYYFSKYQMFLSHIKFIRTDGSSVEVSPLVYFGLNDSTSITPTVSLTNPTGSFTAVQFSIGVDSIQNNAAQSTDPNNPQYVGNDMNWGPSLQYVFAKLEGSADTVNPPLQSIGYHVGTNIYYTTFTITKSFSTSAGSQTTLVLNADFQKLFYGGTNPINILDPSQQVTNTTVNPALAQKFITDLSTIFSLR
jgi:hypothetical protein